MRTYRVVIEGEEFQIGIGPDQAYSLNGAPVSADIRRMSETQYSSLIDGRSTTLSVTGSGGSYHVISGSMDFEVSVESERERVLKMLGAGPASLSRHVDVCAPMPALVVRLEVSVGEKVEAGKGLVVLEAMKMENELKAPRAGMITKIAVTQGKAVEKGELLVVIE